MPDRTRGGQGIMAAMDFTTGTVRACCARVLAAATRPLTVARIAELVDTTPYQAGRALRELEARGAAVRKRGGNIPGGFGWLPDQWRGM